MKVVTYSTCESEYVGLSESGNEAMYLLQLQGELDIGGPGFCCMVTTSRLSS